jgi:RsiW-degrading membrane proteinase PrsW (M82 family)
MDLQTFFYAFFGGLLPAALWLWFWLQEDSVNPEPRGLIVITFGAGIVSVLFVLPIQKLIYYFLGESIGIPALFLLLALVEEALKFLAAYVVAFRSRAFDEPVDAIIYMVTAALGFTALENAFFLFSPLAGGDIVDSVLTGNMRFIGASVLHVVSSAVVGLSLALSFYRPSEIKKHMIIIGILTATILHTAFNLSIITSSGSNMFITFLVLWFSVVGLLLFFEKIKRLNPIKLS